MANKEQLRRAYVDLLYVSGQLPGIEHLFARHAEAFEPIPLADLDAVDERVESARVSLAEGHTGEDGDVDTGVTDSAADDSGERGAAPPLSSPEWLRVIATIIHHRARRTNGEFPEEGLIELGRNAISAAGDAAPTGETVATPPDEDAEAEINSVERMLEVFRLHIKPSDIPSTPNELLRRVVRLDSHREIIARIAGEEVRQVYAECEVEPIPTPPGESAVRITTSYKSERVASDFIYPADPFNWPLCNSFFKSMEPIGAKRAFNQRDHEGDAARLAETVDFGYMTVTTNLDIVFYKSPDTQDPQATGMTFQWAPGGDGLIDVDHGHLRVETLPNDPDGYQTSVRATKTLRFSPAAGIKGDAAMTGGYWACQLGWLNAMKQMNRCSANG